MSSWWMMYQQQVEVLPPPALNDSFSNPEGKPSDLETSGFTSTSAVGVSSSEDSEKIDLLAELQAAALLEA
ncbi:hypothetical protein Q8A67_021816 [Cirrhinus molitorella]|uniref:Uncharacterized protein n=1 Tax=Cirrhinus molitorella TaxID=172907 RepID=A0AA88TN40_9TELE|nr:hypothetical protein Q8A67_021816 [Cirrhinus molitorella]